MEDIDFALDSAISEKPSKEPTNQAQAQEDKDRIRRMFRQKKPKRNEDE